MKPNRNGIALAGLALVSMLVGVGLFQFIDSPQASTPVNTAKKAAPSLKEIPFTGLDGSAHLLKDWDQPILVVNFWAPWCAPCRREIPALVEVQKQYGDQIQVIGLALDSVENVRNFSIEQPMNYPSFIADSNIPMYNAAFGNKTGSLPFTAFIDQHRKLRDFHTGELTIEEFREKIDALL